MVKLKFVVKDNSLALRISEKKERYYKYVKGLLIGSPNIKRHWSDSKERFTAHASSSEENNKILESFKATYARKLAEYPEITAKELANFFSDDSIFVSPINRDFNYVETYLIEIIEREKVKQGCNFESYAKLLTKCRRIIDNFSLMRFQTIDYRECVRIAHIFAKHKGYRGTAKMFRSVLGKASKDIEVDFDISQIKDFKFSDYNPDKHYVEMRKPDVLSKSQLKGFLNLDLSQTTPTYHDRRMVELYYDFSLFMFHSFFAPCDVVKLKHRDITNNGFIRTKRKKTHVTVEVPISPVMQIIIDKYKGQSKDGYVFPIIDEAKEKTYKTKDYTTKNFRENLNKWLKVVGQELGVSYNLYGYVFRHTAITLALDSGLTIAYVALVAGTSIKMIQEHYYNGDSVENKNKLHSAFMKAAV